MTPVRFNPNGMHIIEMMFAQTATDLLPGLLPTEDDPGDAWDDSDESGGRDE